MSQDPQPMPETRDRTESYLYCVFPIHAHTFSLKGSTVLLVFGIPKSLVSVLMYFGVVIRENKGCLNMEPLSSGIHNSGSDDPDGR